MVINGTEKLFSLEEISYIDNMWNDNLIVFKEGHRDRYYTSVNLETKESDKIVKKLVEWFNTVNEEKILVNPEELILHRFEVGSYFDKHKDDQITKHGPRKYLAGISLNDNFEGGKFFTYENEPLQIGKEVGVPYLMKSTVLHEVTKVTKGIRKSAFIFLYEKNFINDTIPRKLF